jgi:CubicO group peptidase (beta-lactamase class C family)
MNRARWIAWIFILLASPMALAAQAPSAVKIGQVFTEWSSTKSPGCALAVVKDGRIVFEHGYGMANLELGVPITPQSVFDIGSVSKQFTAMSILLLMQDGRLSLDDDIRKYLPEMPDYGAKITIRHMLHHTSGLRDYDDLFDLVGIPEADLTTDHDAYQLIVRQKALNFPTGQEYLYSDTGYFLMADIVERITGQTLRQFAQARIFSPLGMTSTHFHDDHTMIVPHRATGYAPHAGGGFEIDMSNFEQLGDGSVMTTVEDLYKWDQNFYNPRVGGADAIKLMTTPGTLDNGKPISYGMGLMIDSYHGLRWIHHSGEWVGYRAALSRFPDQHFSVLVTCNCVGKMNPLRMSTQVADLYLADEFHDKQAPTPSKATAINDDPAQYAGGYWSEQTGAFRRFDVKDGRLVLQSSDSSEDLVAVGNGEFEHDSEDSERKTQYSFRQSKTGAAYDLHAVEDGTEISYQPVKTADSSAERLAEYAGEYSNDELRATWTLVVKNGKLIRQQWMNWDQELRPVFADGFTSELSEGEYMLHFLRDANNHVTGFDIATELVRPMRFHRTGSSGLP